MGESVESTRWERSPSDGASSYEGGARSQSAIASASSPAEGITAAISRDPSKISRELKRNGTRPGYLAVQAHALAQQRRARKPDDPDLNDAVRSGLAQKWSPKQIEGAPKLQFPAELRRRVSAPTIYAWIERDQHKDHWKSFLRRHGKHPWRRKATAESQVRPRVRDRPQAVEQRLRLGDFEGDTILGPPGTGGLVTLVCRRSRLTILARIQTKTSTMFTSGSNSASKNWQRTDAILSRPTTAPIRPLSAAGEAPRHGAILP